MAGVSKIRNWAIGKFFSSIITQIKDDIMLAINFTPASNTAVTTEEILHSLEIGAGLVATNDVVDIFSEFTVTGSANLKSVRMYINSINSLSGAAQVGMTSTNTAANVGLVHQRFLPVLSDTSVSTIAATGTATGYNVSNIASSTVAVTSLSSGFWVIITGQKAVAGETITVRDTFVRNNKL